MFCNNCGYQNDDGAVFCRSCGQKLEAAEPVVDAAPAASSVGGYTYAPPTGYTLKKKRDITLQTRIFSIICAALGLLTIVFFLLPYRYTSDFKTVKYSDSYGKYTIKSVSDGDKKYFSYFTEIGEGFKDSKYSTMSVLMILAMIVFCGCIIAGIVLSILKFKAGAFLILGGALYPLCYSYDFFIMSLSHSMSDSGSRSGYTPFPIIELIIGILTVMSAGLSLATYRLKDNS